MKNNEINFKPLNIQDAFTNKQYLIPEYQREYVWTDKEVKQFIEDIYSEFEDNPESEYFIGCIVVCIGHEGLIEVIDGQQRLTTILIILQAIRSLLTGEQNQQINKIYDLSKSSYTSPAGQEISNYTVKLDYEGKEIIEKIIDGTHADDLSTDTISGGNLIGAYRNTTEFLDTNYGKEADRKGLVKFYGYFVNSVKLVQIATQDIESALKIFETINDRGIGLDSVDLLKNLLFAQVPREEFKTIRSQWMAFKKPLDKAKERPLRFLRYYLMSAYDTFSKSRKDYILREDDVYGWLRSNDDQCAYKEKPSKFIEKLEHAANYYVDTSKGKLEGIDVVELANLQYLVGSGSKQQAALLLSAMPLREKSKKVFYHFVEQLETLFFYYILTKEPAKLIERRFANWSQYLRLVKDATSLNKFLEEHFFPDIKDREKSFDFQFSQLTYTSLPKYRLKYILARMTQYINKARLGDHSRSPVDELLKGAIHIEHILPFSFNQELLDIFAAGDRSIYEEYRNKLGNLTLLERPINASLGRDFFHKKQEKYKASDFYITKTLSGFDDGGKKDSISRTNTLLLEFSAWKKEDIDNRQIMLREISKLVWKYALYEK